MWRCLLQLWNDEDIYIYIYWTEREPIAIAYYCWSTHFQHKWKFTTGVDLKQLAKETAFNYQLVSAKEVIRICSFALLIPSKPWPTVILVCTILLHQGGVQRRSTLWQPLPLPWAAATHDQLMWWLWHGLRQHGWRFTTGS